MKIISAIAKQEIYKVFKNKKMLSSIFVLPLMVLVAMFAITSIGMEEETQSTYQIHLLNSQVQEQELTSGDIVLKIVPETAVSYEQFVDENTITENDWVVEVTEEGLLLYYNSLSSGAESLLQVIKTNILKPYAEAMYMGQKGISKENFDIITEDTSSELERKNRTVSLLLPYMMIIILFMNLVNVVGDSIAGEKERGTLTKQLLAPIDNSEMILGKLLGTTILGMIFSAVFFVVLVGGSFLVNQFGGVDILGIGEGMINAKQIVIMFCGFIFIAMIFVAGIALMSSFANSIKEATQMSLVIYYMVIVAALATGFTVGEVPKIAYAIPVYNFCVFMSKFLVGTVDVINGAITVITLLITFSVLAIATIFNFRREKVIY